MHQQMENYLFLSHFLKAADAGLPKPPAPIDNSDDKLKTEQPLLQLLQAQQAGSQAKTETDTSNTCTDDQAKRYHQGLKEQLVSWITYFRGISAINSVSLDFLNGRKSFL